MHARDGKSGGDNSWQRHYLICTITIFSRKNYHVVGGGVAPALKNYPTWCPVIFFRQPLGSCHWKSIKLLERDSSIFYSRLAGLSPSLSCSQTWNPMLGLINDLRDDRATIPAAALSRVWVLRFVCLHFDHHGFVRLLKRAIRVAAFRSLFKFQ